MNLLSIFRPKPVIIHVPRYVVATKSESAAYAAKKKATTAQLRAEMKAANGKA